MQDIQPPNKNNTAFTPNNPMKGRIQELRNQMDIERSSINQSPYSNDLLYQSLVSNIRDEADEEWLISVMFNEELQISINANFPLLFSKIIFPIMPSRHPTGITDNNVFIVGIVDVLSFRI